ncbi:MAG: glycosyltransferase [Candidatus Eremiobacteraeota bacterium]|nr:glycosyltransferase [Candidatus Eremiobacteraeota bacterium]
MAFVHDYLTQLGGAERVLLELLKLYPEAPLFTSVSDRQIRERHFGHVDVRASFLQRVPGAARNFRALLPLYPVAFASLDLHDYDLVISSTTSFAKGVRVGPRALHVCYINTPTRFLWFPAEYAAEVTPALLQPAAALVLPGLRLWDHAAAQRPHIMIANSQHVAQRVRDVYQRSAAVVHCPVDASAFSVGHGPGDYLLVISRLLPYKRVHLAIEACNTLSLPLVIAGIGPDADRLRRLAGPSVRFVGHVDDARRRTLMSGARAVIIPGHEDFGLVPLEAAASGRPAIAYAAGGALETIVEGATGLLFREPTADALAQTLQRLAATTFDPVRMAEHVSSFSPELFRERLAALIAPALRGRQNGTR